ncbi:hypothetical protein ABIB15_002701 [Marisediminicola sp. UYEF4]|uniref:FHA domain-containing protein n=1 Tax=Marisediminicola sp. UYEF4 TaxID=1756384 RepID=UPI0033924211
MDDDDLADTVIRPARSPVEPSDRPDDDTIVKAPPPLVLPDDGRVSTRSRERAVAEATAQPEPSTPARYRFSVNSAEPLPLDVPALIGRDPRPPRVASAVLPRFVRVNSPRREVSATHLELRQDGTSVIVTDMRSTNGTVITVPGMPEFTLHAGGSMVVAPGTTLDLGDDNIIEIMPIGRLLARDLEPFERLSP